MIAPCKGCTERTVEPNCHGICERYLAFREQQEKLYEKRQIDAQARYVQRRTYERIRREGIKKSKQR